MRLRAPHTTRRRGGWWARRARGSCAGALRSYPGNYSEFQRATEGGAGAAPAADAAPATVADAKRERIAAREREKERARRLERARRQLAALEEDILADEERVEELTRELMAPDVYRDPDFLRVALAERDEVRAAIAARYADWEAIAAEIESLERAAPG